MCFKISYSHREPKIAKKDITCYKVVYPSTDKTKIRSTTMDFYYVFKRKNKKVKLIPKFGEINNGYHSYSSKKMTYINMTKLRLVVECVIPKDTLYYFNPDYHEYVSENIIVNKIITIK